jgi:hypothetical protein
MLKKLGYHFLCSKNNSNHYFKIIQFMDKYGKKEKGIFLQINYENKKKL